MKVANIPTNKLTNSQTNTPNQKQFPFRLWGWSKNVQKEKADEDRLRWLAQTKKDKETDARRSSAMSLIGQLSA